MAQTLTDGIETHLLSAVIVAPGDATELTGTLNSMLISTSVAGHFNEVSAESSISAKIAGE